MADAGREKRGRGSPFMPIFPFRDGIITTLTFGPVVAATTLRASKFRASGLSRRRPHPATGSGLLPT